MHVDHLGAARPFVQVIDVLGHEGQIALQLAGQPREGGVRRVGRDLGRLRAPRVVKAHHKGGIACVAFRRRDVLYPVLRPQPAFVAKRAQPAFGRDARACQDHNVGGHTAPPLLSEMFGQL